MNSQKQIWEDLHKRYGNEDWIKKPTLFAQEIINYFPKSGKILELGAGQGQDSRYFAENGYDIISTDICKYGIESNRKLNEQNEIYTKRIHTKILDISMKKFPFNNDEFDIVYSHLAIHYFTEKETHNLFNEIYRILKPNGILAFLVNSTSDPQYGTEEKLEENYYMMKGMKKRFFDIKSVASFIGNKFQILLLDDEGKTYKDKNYLVRFVGKK